MKTLVIGLDAACDPVLSRVFAAGAAPRLSALVDEGASGGLESQIPPWTPSAWPALYTGKNPGKHGVFDFLRFDGYDWSVVTGADLRARPVWELLDDHGYRSVVVNAPVTAPPAPFDGALVPGYTAPERPPCHPPGLLDGLAAAVGDYRVYPDHDGEDATLAEKRAAYEACARSRGAAFRHLADEYDPDFGFLQFQVTDTVFHECPGEWSVVEAVYAAVDEAVGATLDACDPDTVLVVSDHGMGEYGGHEFRVNEWLEGRGYVETTRGGDGMPTWGAALDRGDDGDRDDPSPLARGVALAARAGVTSQRVGAVLDRLGLADAVRRRVPDSVVRAGVERVDFTASTAYVRSRTECGVRLNVAGRDPEGVVAPDEYEAVREELMTALRGVETPDGDPVFETVAPREQYFQGPYTDEAVDIVTVPAEFDQFLSASLKGDVFGPPSEPYNHKLEGFVAASGAGIDASASLAGAHVFDIAPTVLATFGLPAEVDMDGEPLAVVESRGRARYGGDRTRVEADGPGEQVTDRLRGMGYIE
jgi:predicted AlkP superfamily phosphohydrolase/phosphomutase